MNIDVFQKTIHRLEVGGGLRYLRLAMMILAVLILTFLYDLWSYKNMGTQEAMDSAQVARNLSQGKGFTTLFVRPFSLHLIQEHNQKLKRIPQQGNLPDPSEIRRMHPDLANPPLYPVVLAGLMRVLPFEFPVPTKAEPFWTLNGVPTRYQPDFLITVFNQLLWLGTVVLVFLLARRLFDKSVAWLSATLLLGTELLWRFSSSGLSTMLLLLLFTGLAWCLVLLETELREPRWGDYGLYGLPFLVGVLVGAGTLTRYSFGWLIVPVLLFVILSAIRQRVLLAITVFLGFAAVLGPWIFRNYHLSGTPFGTATYTLIEATPQFSEHRLERSIEPDFSQVNILRVIKDKLVNGAKQILQNDLPKLGGSWVSAFYLAGLLVVYQQPSVRRLRLFLLGSLVVLALAQALGRTQLSEDSPELNSENLLVLLAPLVAVYGANLFLLLLEQVEWPFRELRYAAVTGFVLLAAVPLLVSMLIGKTFPLSYPPYYPSAIQSAANWVKEDELTMSDMPWAMAWYGQSQCVWLTLNSQADFFAINDYQKAVQEIFLTQLTTDSRFLSYWVRGGDQAWGQLIFSWLVRRELKLPGPPPKSPLPFWQQQLMNPQGKIVTVWPDIFLLTVRQQPAR